MTTHVVFRSKGGHEQRVEAAGFDVRPDGSLVFLNNRAGDGSGALPGVPIAAFAPGTWVRVKAES